MPREAVEYVNFWPKAKPDEDWSKLKLQLISTVADLEAYVKDCKDAVLALDFETRSLNFDEPNFIVGFSLAKTAYDAVYVPIRHHQGTNAPVEILQTLAEVIYRNRILVYNWSFEGIILDRLLKMDMARVRCLDVSVLVYLADTNQMMSLKEAARHYLGRDCMEFEEVLGEKARFDEVDPKLALTYAGADAANTWGLYEVLYQQINKECPFILKLDMAVANAMVKLLQSEVTIDQARMLALAGEIGRRIQELERTIFRRVGYPFALDSRKQVAEALISLGLDTKQRTPTGQMVVGEDGLKTLDHPIGGELIERASLVKQRSSYVEKLAATNKGRFSFMTTMVPTGRFASGNSKSDFFLKMNFQNFTKPTPAFFRVTPDPEGVLGNRFTLLSDEEVSTAKKAGDEIAEGLSPRLNVRSAITVPNQREWYFVSIDYSLMELWVAGQLSKDPVMMAAFKNGQDLHAETAKRMFGEANYNKEMRKRAKTCNFGLLYGGSPYTLQHASGLPIEECEVTFQKYWETMSGLRRWIRQRHQDCYRRNGVTYTPFGRPRRLKFYLGNSNLRVRRFGERSVISHLVQGGCADAMRLGLVGAAKKVFLKRDDVRWVGAVHDELDFCVRKEVCEEVIREVQACMEVEVPNCPLRLKTSPSVGWSYGDLWEFTWKDNHLVPVVK